MKTQKDLINFINNKGFDYTIKYGEPCVTNSVIKLKEPKMVELKYIDYKPKRIVTDTVLLKGIVFRQDHGGNLMSTNTPYMTKKIRILIYESGMNIDLDNFLDIKLIE